MLRKRLIASACFIIPVLGILWLDSNWNFGLVGIWSVLATAIACLVISTELVTMIRDKTAGVNRAVVFGGALLCHLAIVLPAIVGDKTPLLENRWALSCGALFLLLLTTVLCEVFTYRPGNRGVERIALTMLCVTYSSWLLGFFSAVRLTGTNMEGVFAIFSIMFIIKMSDAGAYFVGKNLGRNKLAPLLSPGKTVEGLVGGLVAAIGAAYLAFWVIKPWMCGAPASVAGWAIAGYAISITIVGVFGDLSESLIKREMGVKDSSGWLPGLGGIMDTADSVILAAPLAYAWWSLGIL